MWLKMKINTSLIKDVPYVPDDYRSSVDDDIASFFDANYKRIYEKCKSTIMFSTELCFDVRKND